MQEWHEELVKNLIEIMMRFDAVRNGTLPLSALYEIFDSCDIVDDWIAELFFPLHFLIFRHMYLYC